MAAAFHSFLPGFYRVFFSSSTEGRDYQRSARRIDRTTASRIVAGHVFCPFFLLVFDYFSSTVECRWPISSGRERWPDPLIAQKRLLSSFAVLVFFSRMQLVSVSIFVAFFPSTCCLLSTLRITQQTIAGEWIFIGREAAVKSFEGF